MPITVQHTPSARSLAGPAFNAGFGQFLQNYQRFLQPERMQQQGFAQQRYGQAVDIAADQQRQRFQAAQNAARQAQQQQYGLMQSLMQNRAALQSQVLGGQLSALRDQTRHGYNRELQGLSGDQRLAAIDRQGELMGRRQEVAFQNGLYANGLRDQDQMIRHWRSSIPSHSLSPESRSSIDGLLFRRQKIQMDRKLLPQQQQQALQQNFADIQQAFENASRVQSPEESWQQEVLWKSSPEGGALLPWTRNRNGQWQIDSGYKVQEPGKAEEAKLKIQQAEFKAKSDYAKYVLDVQKARMDWVKAQSTERFDPAGNLLPMPNPEMLRVQSEQLFPVAEMPQVGSSQMQMPQQPQQQQQPDWLDMARSVQPPQQQQSQESPTASWVKHVSGLGMGGGDEHLAPAVNLAVGSLDLSQPLPPTRLSLDDMGKDPAMKKRLSNPAVRQAVKTINTLRGQFGGKVLPEAFHLDYVRSLVVMVLGYNPTPATEDEIKQIPSGELYYHFADNMPRRRK